MLPTDTTLDRMDGSLASELPKMYSLVNLNSSTEEVDMITGYKLGCNSYIRKPVDYDQFSKSITQLGLYWLVLNEPPPGVETS